MNIKGLIPLALLCSAVTAGAAETAEKTADTTIWNRDTLTGDWGGLRTDLSDHGIDIGLRASEYGQRVATGGAHRGNQDGGTMDYRLDVNTNKLFGTWEGFTVNAHARTRWGSDSNADAGALVLPNAGMMMPLPGDYDGTDLTGLTVTQTFPLYEGHLGALTVGQLDVIDTVTGFFPNISAGQEGFWNVNSQVSAMPWFGGIQGLSLFGGIFVSINEEYQVPESGALVVGTQNVSTSWGRLSDSFDDVYVAGFHRFFWELDDDDLGYFMVYVGGSTKDQASNDPKDFIEVPGQGIESTEEHKPWDIALYVYQEFWKSKADPNRKITVLLGGSLGPDNPQFAQYNAFANIEAFGLIRSRPADRIGVGAWWNGLSDDFKDLASEAGDDLTDPWGLEAYYNYELTPWAHISADLQLVQNQNDGDDFAIMPGIRMVIDL
jgi:porin